jgi:hypothetical protein
MKKMKDQQDYGKIFFFLLSLKNLIFFHDKDNSFSKPYKNL